MVGWHHQLKGNESGRWWRAGKPGVLQFVGWQRVAHLATEQCLFKRPHSWDHPNKTPLYKIAISAFNQSKQRNTNRKTNLRAILLFETKSQYYSHCSAWKIFSEGKPEVTGSRIVSSFTLWDQWPTHSSCDKTDSSCKVQGRSTVDFSPKQNKTLNSFTCKWANIDQDFVISKGTMYMYVSPVSPNILIRENIVPPLLWIPIRVVASALPKGHICFSQSPFGGSTALFLVQLSQSCKGCQSTYITAPGYSDWSKRKVGNKKKPKTSLKEFLPEFQNWSWRGKSYSSWIWWAWRMLSPDHWQPSSEWRKPICKSKG